MRQTRVPAVFMRGGTSKGLFFRADDLPAGTAEHDAIFKAALGSPDRYGRQLDGMGGRSEEHTSELQSLMRISYAVFCLKKKKTNIDHKHHHTDRSTQQQ